MSEDAYHPSKDECEMLDRALRRSAKRVAVAVPIEEFDSLKSQLSQALREREAAETARIYLLRLIVGLTKQLATAITSNAELRGALDAMANDRSVPAWLRTLCRTALASSSTPP